MRKVYFLLLAVLFVAAVNAQVSVTATAGTTGPTPYTDLSSAFSAINAGTHQGAITIDLSASFTDPAVSVLNSSGAGTASYTSVLIRPTADAVTMSYATVTGRGVIELNGADNVTIDGDNPNTAGTNRNLTIQNTAVNTITFTAIVRLATSTAVTSCDNVIIRNCVLLGSATGRNVAGATSTTASENTTFGVFAGGNGGATAPVAPTALTSVTANTAPSGTTINGLVVNNNVINQCARGIVFNGAATSVSTGITVTNNTLGTAGVLGAYPYTTPATTVYTKGIWVAGTNALAITGNTLYNILSYVGTTMTGIELVSPIGAGTVNIASNTITAVTNNGTSSGSNGIQISSAGGPFSITGNIISTIQDNTSTSESGILINTSGGVATISGNTISGIYARSTGGYGAFGIQLTSAANGCIIQNNFIFDLNAVDNNSATSTLGPIGIRLTSGNNHKVYHNSVNLSGAALAGGSAAEPSACLMVTTTALTGLDIRNNIFQNTRTGSFTGSVNSAISLPSGLTGSANYTINNNAYYAPTGTNSYMASTNGTSVTYTTANFNAGATSPATNWRSYSSTLSASGTNDNSSYGITTAAPFVSATDLHIPAATITVLESGGAAVGVTTDIDNEARNATTPDIGADEFAGVFVDLAPPAILYTPAIPSCTVGDIIINNVTITDVSGVPTTGGLMPRIYYRKNGGAYVSSPGSLSSGTGTNGVWSFTIVAANLGGLASSDLVNYYIIAQDVVATPNISSNPAGAVATDVNTVTTHPVLPNSYVSGSMSGTYTVGTGGSFTTLTLATTAYNNACLTGPVVFSLTDATYPAETFPITINSNVTASATNTLTIRPAAGNIATISGSSTAAILKLNGADYVTIDGSNSGGTSRDLTLNNTHATGATVIWLGSAGASDGASNNTVKNVTTLGQGSLATFVSIFSGSGATAGSIAEAPNNNNVFDNNMCQRAQYGIAIAGSSSAQTGNVISNNLIGSNTVADYIGYIGMFVSNNTNLQVNNNTVFNIITTATNPMGINVVAGVINSSINANTIRSIRYTGTSGYGGKGMNINTNTATSNLTISNNMISDIAGDGWNSLLGDAIVGIRIGATGGSTVTTGGINLYNNTVNLGSGTFAGSTSGTVSAALYLSSTTSNLDIRNNILSSNLVNSAAAAAKTYAINSAAANTAFTTINNNNYYVSGTQGVLGFIGSDRATLAAIQTGFGGNTASINFNSTFVSATDLHLVNTDGTNWCLDGAGVNIAAVTTDIDGAARNNPPDIGADEFAAAGLTITNPAAVCEPLTVDITAPGVTAGSMAGLTLTYFTDAAATNALANPNAVAVGGTYYIKATNGTCSIVRPVVVAINAITTATPTIVQPTTCVSTDGSITLVLTGAPGPYTFAWTGPGVNATSQDQTGLGLGLYQVTITPASGCPTIGNYALIGPGGCSVCPTVGAVTTTPATTTCTNTNVTMNATGLATMGVSYGITFKYSATALADPYTGGTVFSTVPNGGLGGGGTTAAATSTFAAPGNYFVYAVLSPTPADPICRPFAQTTLLVNSAPVVTCPANITVSNTAGQCGAVVNYPAAVVTGVPAPTVTYSTPSGSVFPVGITTVTVTATNSCGTTNCTFTVRVNDTQQPTVTCPANISTPTLAGQCSRVVTFTPTATDNCSGVTVTSVPASGSTFALGTTTVIVTARDASNNTSACSFTVTVTDSQLPVITAQPVASRTCATNTATFSVTATNAVSYQWQVNTGGGFNNISGATGSTLTLNNVTLAMSGYLYRVVVNGACTSVTSNAVGLTVSSLPSVSDLTASPYTKLSPGMVTTLTATYNGFPGNFTWYRNNSVARVTLVPTIGNITIDSVGTYKVVLTDVNGCTATSPDLIISADPDFRFFVYPNPNNGHFQVRFYAYSLGVKRTLNVYDSKGNLVFKREFTVSGPYEKMDVDVSRYTRGYYHVELRDANGKILGSGSALFIQ